VRFFERARSEYLEALGSRVGDLDRAGLHMAVYELRVKYRKPAHLGDRLEVVSTAALTTPYRVSFAQRIERPGERAPLCEATVEVVCIDDDGRLLKIPDEVIRLVAASPA
jgi:YbgC/YbaW family acyl-CoA thioester hydrolase